MGKSFLFAVSCAAIMCLAAGCSARQTVRIVTYNVGTFTKFQENSMSMVADMMKELDAGIISMNELDSCTQRTGVHYQLKEFADKMGQWQYIFGSAMPYDGGAYGDGLTAGLSYPVIDSWSVRLPQGDGAEPRALVVMEFDGFVVASTHLDHVSDSAQVIQVQAITDRLKEKYGNGRKPVFLCGDMNAVPGSRTMDEFARHWTVISKQETATFPSDTPAVCIDYILALEGSRYEVVESAVPLEFESGDVSMASDHLPVFADVRIRK